MPAQAHMVAMLAGFSADPAREPTYYNDHYHGVTYTQSYDRNGPRLATQTMKRQMRIDQLSYSQALGGFAPMPTASQQAEAFGHLGNFYPGGQKTKRQTAASRVKVSKDRVRAQRQAQGAPAPKQVNRNEAPNYPGVETPVYPGEELPPAGTTKSETPWGAIVGGALLLYKILG